METEVSQLPPVWSSPGLVPKPCLVRLEAILAPCRGRGAGATDREAGDFPLSLYPSKKPQSSGATLGHPSPSRQPMETPSDHTACLREEGPCLPISNQLSGLFALRPSLLSPNQAASGMSPNISQLIPRSLRLSSVIREKKPASQPSPWRH